MLGLSIQKTHVTRGHSLGTVDVLMLLHKSRPSRLLPWSGRSG